MFIVNITNFNQSNFEDYDFDYDSTSNGSNDDPSWIFTPKTAPLFLIILLPMISLKSPTIFTKFNSVGTLNVFFLLGVIMFLGGSWGINASFTDPESPDYIPMFKKSFPSLSGMMALGLFIHNAIITIVKNNRYQENNVTQLMSIILMPYSNLFFFALQRRDLAAGFTLVSGTYMLVGVLFYLTFPMDKQCIEDVRV